MSKARTARRRAAVRASAPEPTPPIESEVLPKLRVPRSESSIEVPTVFAFVGSGCLLVLELVAARLIAPFVGVSLYTWTSVIGVVLGGVSLGNYLGGRLADRWPSRSVLALVYAAAAASALAVLGVLRYADSLELPNSAPALLQVLWLTAILFLVPSTILGAPTPLLTRLSLASVDRTGRVVGRIQAAAACGSIVGTFLTGFFLISWFGTRLIVAGVAGLLLILAMAARPRWLARHAYEVGSLAALIVVAGWASQSTCLRESSYYCIRVEPAQAVAQGSTKVVKQTPYRALFLDRLLHSVVNTLDPTQLIYYGYERTYAQVMRKLEPKGATLDSYFIGGGGYTFPRWMEANYGGEVTVAEIDPAVTSVARKYLGLDTTGRMQILTGDARRELQTMSPSRRFDVVFGDAFDDYEVPYHLTTRQFDDLVASHLRPNGLYLLNVIDGVHYDFLRSELRTLRETFAYAAVLVTSGGWPPRGGRETFVIVAAKTAPKRKLPVVPARALERFETHGHSVVLTDDYAPVDQLLAPVFQQELQK